MGPALGICFAYTEQNRKYDLTHQHGAHDHSGTERAQTVPGSNHATCLFLHRGMKHEVMPRPARTWLRGHWQENDPKARAAAKVEQRPMDRERDDPSRNILGCLHVRI